MSNYGNEAYMLEQAQATKKKRETMIKNNALHACKKCGQEKRADVFVIQYMDNQLVGKYRYLYECKQCKRERTYQRRHEQRKTIVGASRIIIKHLYQGAKKRNIPFSIDSEDIVHLREKQGGKCYYSGYDMQYTYVGNTSGSLSEKSKYQVSCDRLDTTQGYTPDNIVLCCTYINKMKGSLSASEFYTVCKDILQHKSA